MCRGQDHVRGDQTSATIKARFGRVCLNEEGVLLTVGRSPSNDSWIYYHAPLQHICPGADAAMAPKNTVVVLVLVVLGTERCDVVTAFRVRGGGQRCRRRAPFDEENENDDENHVE